jgi:hypothetical protein
MSGNIATARQALRQHLEHRRLTIGDVLDRHQEGYLARLTIGRVLTWSPEIDSRIAARILTAAGVPGHTPLGHLLDDERETMLEATRRHTPSALVYKSGLPYDRAPRR